MDLSGSVVYRDNEWFLNVHDGLYEIHMEPFGHDESLPFTEGATVEIRGFVLPEHIAPVRVTTGGETYEFRHEQRYPLWAGAGERRNAVEERGDEQGRMQAPGRQLPADLKEAPEDFEPQFRNQDQWPGRGLRY